MRILVVSDFHGRLEAFNKVADQAILEKADLIVVCGDVTQFGNVNDAKKLLSLLTNVKIPLFFVPGNTDPSELVNANIADAVCLHNVCQTINDWSFIGVGGSQIGPLRSLFELAEDEILKILTHSSEKCQNNSKLIVISHAPPFQTELDRVWYGEHVGSISLRKFIIEKKPAAVLCGHIHEASGIDHVEKTVIVNPGPASHGCFGVVDFNEKIEVVLHNLK